MANNDYEEGPCEVCHEKTYPSPIKECAAERGAKTGTIIIRKNKKTGQETRRSIVCLQCNKDMTCTEDEEATMSFVGREGMMKPRTVRSSVSWDPINATKNEEVISTAYAEFKTDDLEVIYDEILKRVYDLSKKSPSEKTIDVYNKALQSLYREKYPPLMQYLEALKEEPIRDEDIPSSVGFINDYTKPTSLHYFTEIFVRNIQGITKGMRERLNREYKPQRYADEER